MKHASIRTVIPRFMFGLLLTLMGCFASQAQAEIRMVQYNGGAFVEISPSAWIEVKQSDAIWGYDSSFVEMTTLLANSIGINHPHPLWPRIADPSNIVLYDAHRVAYVILSLNDNKVLFTRDTVNLSRLYAITATSENPQVSGSAIDWSTLHSFAEPRNRHELACGAHFTLFNISTRTFYGVPVSSAHYYYPSPQLERHNADVLSFSCAGDVQGGGKYSISTAYTGNWPHDWISFNQLGVFRYGVGYYTTGPGSGGDGYAEQYQWEVVLDGRSGAVAFGDKIALRNIYYDQFLIPDTASEQLWTESRAQRSLPVEAYDWIVLPVLGYRADLLADSRQPGRSPIELCYKSCDQQFEQPVQSCAQEDVSSFCPAAALALGCALVCELDEAFGIGDGPLIPIDDIPLPCPGGGGAPAGPNGSCSTVND